MLFISNLFLLQLTSIPSYRCAAVSIFIPGRGILEMFLFLVIMNKAAINICVQAFSELEFLSLSDKYPGVQLLEQIIVVYLVF